MALTYRPDITTGLITSAKTIDECYLALACAVVALAAKAVPRKAALKEKTLALPVPEKVLSIRAAMFSPRSPRRPWMSWKAS